LKDLSTPLLDMVNRKLVETHIDCANPFAETQTATTTTTTQKATVTEQVATTTSPKKEETTLNTELPTTSTEATDATTEATEEATEKTSPPNEEILDFGKRKPVKHKDKKPDVPYRPPMEGMEL
jgi:hypothetical protein